MKNTQNLNCIPLQAIGNYERCPRDNKLACSRNPSRSSHFRAARKQGLNALDDVKDDSPRCCWVVLLYVGPQRDKIVDRLR